MIQLPMRWGARPSAPGIEGKVDTMIGGGGEVLIFIY